MGKVVVFAAGGLQTAAANCPPGQGEVGRGGEGKWGDRGRIGRWVTNQGRGRGEKRSAGGNVGERELKGEIEVTRPERMRGMQAKEKLFISS